MEGLLFARSSWGQRAEQFPSESHLQTAGEAFCMQCHLLYLPVPHSSLHRAEHRGHGRYQKETAGQSPYHMGIPGGSSSSCINYWLPKGKKKRLMSLWLKKKKKIHIFIDSFSQTEMRDQTPKARWILNRWILSKNISISFWLIAFTQENKKEQIF